MKTLLITLALTAGLAFNSNAETTRTGEHKSATSTKLSHAEEMELLKDYFPNYTKEYKVSLRTIQIYDSNFELVYENQIEEMEEIQDQKLNKYLLESDFLMDIENKSLYILEK